MELRKAAAGGNVEAQYALGLAYKSGRGHQRDPKSAREWFHRAAMAGHVLAKRKLASMYYTGDCAEKNIQFALKIWKDLAVNDGDRDTQCFLAQLYFDGTLVQRDVDEALALWKAAIMDGHTLAARQLSKAKKTLVKEARFIEGLVADAKRCFSGDGAEMDRDRAVATWQVAANAGGFGVYIVPADAKVLAHQCLRGSGKCFGFLSKHCAGSLQGDRTAQMYLAELFYSGVIVERDVKRAVKYWQRVAEDNGLRTNVRARAMARLGECYVTGEGVYQDKQVGIKFWIDAIELDEATTESFFDKSSKFRAFWENEIVQGILGE